MRWMLTAAVLATVLAGAAAAEEEAPARVEVTGRLISISGQETVPAGLFGVHAFKVNETRVRDWGIAMVRRIRGVGGGPTEPEKVAPGLGMVIDCLGDRYQPALQLTRPEDWEAAVEKAAREFAEGARDRDATAYAEFWNEPFLNWATKPGVNYDPKFYVQDEAALGKPMRIKGRAKPLESLVWDKAVRSVDEGGRTSHHAWLAWDREGRKHPEGATFTWRGRSYKNVKMWWGRDPTQHSWYSAKQNGVFYDGMFTRFARTVKQANPDVVVIGGWNFNVDLDGWKFWHANIRPTLDAAIEWMDGMDEHHYYVGAEAIPVWYETVVAYTATKHGKRIRLYNTECGGFADTMLPGNEDLADRDKEDALRSAVRVLGYHTRDVMHLLATCPDKAASRAKHGEPPAGLAMSGEEAFFRFFKDLRGRLVQVESGSADVWAVASLNGSDLVAIVYNDAAKAGDVVLAVRAPAGTTLTAGRKVWVEADAAARTLKLPDSPVPVSGEGADVALRVPAKTAVKLIVPLQGTPPAKPGLKREQFFASGVLQKVQPGMPVEMTVMIDAAVLARAPAAHLRLALEGLDGKEAAVAVNGRPLADLATRNRRVLDVPLARDILKPETILTFTCGGDGYQVDCASILLTVAAE